MKLRLLLANIGLCVALGSVIGWATGSPGFGVIGAFLVGIVVFGYTYIMFHFDLMKPDGSKGSNYGIFWYSLGFGKKNSKKKSFHSRATDTDIDEYLHWRTTYKG